MSTTRLPFYTSDELWRRLTTENIRFHTYATRNSIPDEPGLYSWIYPCRVWTDMLDALDRGKRVFRYEPLSGLHKPKSKDHQIHWDNLRITLHHTNEYRQDKRIEETWNSLLDSVNDESLKAIQQTVLLTSLFAKSLYVGLTTRSLSVRYDEHLNGKRNSNDFNNRFNQYMSEQGMDDMGISDLIFVAIPLRLPNEMHDPEIEKACIESVEYIAKNLVGPVFGEK